MAEESVINQVKSEKIEPENGDEKANPVGRLVTTKGEPNILPRYLSAPRGSCHDFCKYGIQHAAEAKPWTSKAQKRVTTRGRKTKVAEETVSSLAGTEKSRSSSKPSLTSKDHGKPNFPVDIKEVTISLPNEEAVTSEKSLPPFEETNVSMELTNSDLGQAPLEPSSLPVQECLNAQTKREIGKSKSPFGSSSRKKTESRSKQTAKSSIEGKNKSMPPSIPVSSKHNVKKPSSLIAKTAKNLTGVSNNLKNHKNVEEVKPELASNDNFPDKVLDIIEPTSTNFSVEPTLACDTTKLSSASPTSSGDKNLKQTNKQIGNLKQNSKQIGKSGLSSFSSKGPRHAGKGIRPVAPSHLSSGNQGKRRMQHKMHSASPSPSPSIYSTNSSLGKQNGGSDTSKINKTGHGYQGENMKVGYKIRPKRNTIVGAANKVIQTRKLTFRRGKVIELQPQSNTNIPRRLKFKPARLLGDDTYYTRKRITRMKEDDKGELNDANIKSEKVLPTLQMVEGSKRRSVVRKVGGGSKIDGSKSGSEQVVLRHQNVEGKKENPRLYNNVIEETASMLAELRKSKVKALVGAFETVISLDSPREATPSEISTAC